MSWKRIVSKRFFATNLRKLTTEFEYCDTVSILKHLKATNDMKKHLIEYKNLMNVKLSLEKEIDVYRSLLEGNFS